MTEPLRPVPEAVERFLARYINSVEQLEILLLLASDPNREWAADDIARLIYTAPDSAARRLRRMADDGLLEPDASGVGYRFKPAKADLAAIIQQLEVVYRERRVAVITSIASRPMDNVQAFSDAFRLGKRRDS